MKKEYDTVLTTGLFGAALFGYDKWINDKLIVNGAPDKEKTAVYRGWNNCISEHCISA